VDDNDIELNDIEVGRYKQNLSQDQELSLERQFKEFKKQQKSPIKLESFQSFDHSPEIPSKMENIGNTKIDQNKEFMNI
jgi:hypothetical protein